MIIYGHRSTKLAAQNLFNVSCPSCRQKSTTEMYVFSKYAHIFWIPAFPMAKVGLSQCEHCKAVLSEKEMTTELKDELRAMKSSVRAPFWQFSGLAIIVFIIGASFVTSGVDAAENKKFIAAPHVGDVYHYKTEGNYSIEKVVTVRTDSVELLLNKMVFTEKSGVNKIDKPENYDGSTEWYAVKELEQQFKDGIIYDVIR